MCRGRRSPAEGGAVSGRLALVWSVAESIDLAREYVPGMGARWLHICTAGRVAEGLAARSGAVSQSVVSAAWLHDIGYSRDLIATGFHPLDGALFLQRMGVPAEVGGLVGHHTGAGYEARERGLLSEWLALPEPEQTALDVLTMIDLAVGPTGYPEMDVARIDGILSRYGDDDPVHRAVARSRDHLLASSSR